MGLYEQGIRQLANEGPEEKPDTPELYARSLQEIADELGISHRKVRTIYDNAIRKIQPELKKIRKEFGL